jgi:catechol 2,3-dioxygenase-like lactoylglutathione lyase family enzyme
MGRSRIVLLVGILIFVVTAATAAAESAAEKDAPYAGVEFRRWSAIVSNLDEAIHLYSDILGFELGEIAVDPKTSYVYEMFAIDPEITTRHAMFHAGDKKRVLTVVEVPGITLQKPPQSPRMSVALFNANGRFDEIIKQLIAENYQVLTPRKLADTGIEIGFIDNDGHLHALYEYPYTGSDFGKILKSK